MSTTSTTVVLRFADEWDIQWKDCNEDLKDFYESLRSWLEYYVILLKPYMKLSRDEDICGLSNNTCENYNQVHPEMSRALYTVLLNFRQQWFAENPKLDTMLHFEDNRDGFSLLKELIKTFYPNLKDRIKCKTMDKPAIEPFLTWFQYMKQYRWWVQYKETSDSRRQYTEYEHLSNILKEIEKYNEFDTARQKIESKIQTLNHDEKNPFPKEFKLQNVVMTLHKMLPKEAQSVLPLYVASSLTPEIGKVNTWSDAGYQQKKFKDKNLPKDGDTPSSLWERHNVICPACCQADHDVTWRQWRRS